MTYRVTLSLPDGSFTDAPLNAVTEVSGYRAIPSPDGVYVSIEYKMGDENPGAGDAPANEAPNLGPHTIKVFDASNVLLVQYDLTMKLARTHFRYPPMCSVVKRPVKWLIDNNFVPPFGYADITCFPRPALTYDGPNSWSGMSRAMAATGERVEIGIFPEDAAETIMGNDPTNMFIQAECAGAAPLFFVDKATGKPIDKRTYPTANDYSYGSQYHGAPWMPATGVPDDPSAVSESSNHAPNLSFIAAMLTDDGWHLRNLQHWFNTFMLDNGGVAADGSVFITMSEQRDIAWNLDKCVCAYIATRWFEQNNILPKDCLDSGYFLAIINNTIKYTLDPIMAAPDFQVARCFWNLGESACAPWQQAYLLDVLGLAVLNGITQLQPHYLWALGLPVAMNSGKSGWAAALPSVYFLSVGAHGARFPTWGAVLANYKLPKAQGGQLGDQLSQTQLDAINADPFNGGVFLEGFNQEYPMFPHGNLAMALYLKQKGIVDTVAAYPDLPVAYANLHRMFVNREQKAANTWNRDGSWYYDARHAMSFDGSKLPPDITVQPTPIGQLPAPEPIPDPQPQPESPPMSIVDEVKAEVAVIKSDVAALILAAHSRIAAIIAAAAGNAIDPAALQGPLDDLKTLHEQLTAEASALPTATN